MGYYDLDSEEHVKLVTKVINLAVDEAKGPMMAVSALCHAICIILTTQFTNLLQLKLAKQQTDEVINHIFNEMIREKKN